MINNISQITDASQVMLDKKEQKVAKDFEAIFLRQILNENMGDNSEEMETIKNMYNGEIAKEMSAAGGFGLADIMVMQWRKKN